MTEPHESDNLAAQRRVNLNAAIKRVLEREMLVQAEPHAPTQPNPTTEAVELNEPAFEKPTIAELTPESSMLEAPDEPAEMADPVSSDHPREGRYRDAVNRALNRPRSEAETPLERPKITAASLGRTRSPARPRVRETVPEPVTEPTLEPAVESESTLAEAEMIAEPTAPTKPRRTPSPAVLAALEPDTLPPAEIRPLPIWFALAAGIGWTIMLILLETAKLNPYSSLNWRIGYTIALVVLGILTWAPLQWALRLPALTWRGTVGAGIILWMLAFAHPPTKQLIAGLPDLPVYLILFCGIFLLVDAIALPLTYVWGIRRYHNRQQRFDTSRARRQAAEIGLFVTLCIVLATMNILEPMTVFLLVAIFGLAEMVFLSLSGE